MEEKDIKTATVDELLALCEILDDFEEFNRKLVNLTSRKYTHNISKTYRLWKKSKGKRVLSIKINEFYNENKQIIDTINKYSDMATFIYNNYNKNDKIDTNKLDYFYRYIIKNREQIDKIKELLDKLKSLHVSKIEFDDNLKFTDNKYKIHENMGDNSTINYVDNIEIIPSYNDKKFKYRTTGSNYEIQLEVFSFGKDWVPYLKLKKVTVNSLLFDCNRLPESLTDEQCVFDPIIRKNKEYEKEYTVIQDSIDFRLDIDNINDSIEDIEYLVEYRLGKVTNKEELVKLLENLKENANELKRISKNYDKKITKEYPDITKQALKKERKKCK